MNKQVALLRRDTYVYLGRALALEKTFYEFKGIIESVIHFNLRMTFP